MATWEITPTEGVTNNNDGSFVFDKNEDLCSDRDYTITYTDDSGCTGTTTYTIPRKPAGTDVTIAIGLSPDHGIGSYGNPIFNNVSGDDEIYWSGSSDTGGTTYQFYADKLLGCKSYSLSMDAYHPDSDSPCDCNQTTSTSNDCANYMDCYIRPQILGNFLSGSWQILESEAWPGYYNGTCTLYNASTNTTVEISVRPSNAKSPINCEN